MPYCGIVLVCDWLIWVRWKATGAANAKATQKDLMTKASQSSPSPLTEISQSEGAALEIWNRLNKMKWTKHRKKSFEEKISEIWEGKKGKWKMERKHWVLRITMKHTVENKVITITLWYITLKYECPKTGQCFNSAKNWPLILHN